MMVEYAAMVSKLNPSHKRLRIVLTFVAIAGLLFVTEWVLRSVGYGYNPHFIVKTPDGNALTPNPRFVWRYFPPSMAREPVPFLLPVQKVQHTKRIVILGDSVAAGFPDTAFGFGRFLEPLLSAAEPDTHFEIINTATVALNSHVATILSKEAVANDADVIICYLGNTEIVGPYGPGTVFARYTPSLSSIRFRQWLAGTRIGQLRDQLVRATTSRAASRAQWQGMEMFIGNPITEDSPRAKAAHAHFRDNVKRITSVARTDKGPLVLLCTIPTNLRDAAPFGSLLSSATRGQAFDAWKQAFEAGTNEQAKAQHALAAMHFNDALRIDDKHAELHFRLALSQEALGEADAAREHYTRARDLDTLRFRADSRMNAVVRETVMTAKSPRVLLVDAERELQQLSMSAVGCPGEEFFHEHVHLNVDGHYAVARTIFSTLAENGFVTKPEKPLSNVACAEQLSLTSWAEYKMALSILDIVRRPPFNQRFDHADRVNRQIDRIGILQGAVSEAGLVRTVIQCEDAYARHPQDPHLIMSLARLYTEFGRYDNAAEMWSAASRIQPLSASIQHNLGTALTRAGAYSRAEAHCRRAVELQPYVPGYRNNLGNIYYLNKNYPAAEKAFKKAIKLAPDLPAGHLNLGGVYATLARNQAAIKEFKRALELSPNNAKAYNNLGAVYESMDRMDSARDAYLNALKNDEHYLEAHLNLASLFQKLGDPASAIPHFAKVAQLKPNDAGAHYNYAVVLASQNHLDAAIRETAAALKLRPDWEQAKTALKRLAQSRMDSRTNSETPNTEH